MKISRLVLFFQKYALNLEIIKNAWIEMYCNDPEKSKECKRKIYKDKNGVMPVPNMAPSGKLI